MRELTEDIERLMTVMDCSFDPRFGEAWTKPQIEDALRAGICDYFLISGSGCQTPVTYNSNQDDVAGFYLSRHIITDTELLLLAVNPAFRRRGLGKLLLNQLVANAKGKGADRIFLEMRRGNPAENLYRTFGFVPVGERPNYYRTRDGKRIDAITFAMSI